MTKDPTQHPFDAIDSPHDLRQVPESQLDLVCSGMREFLIDSISKTGGHLGAGLGTVELTVALHYVFNTPIDKIVWDVGHQAYPHKLLTGRKDRFHTIRQLDGLSGFLKRDESEYDIFGAGHASTAISAALGIATARDLKKHDFKVLAVVGDGAMTGGMAYEAMNNCGFQKRDIIVVLNDNNMSISKNVWALSEYFNEFVASATYNRFRNNMWQLAGKFEEFGDLFRKIASRIENGLKAVLTPGILFEALGFRYFGPIHGHHVNHLVQLFREVKEWRGPVLVHVVTEKGKGYKPAEADEQRLHGVTPFDKITGKAPVKSDSAPTYTSIFGATLTQIARQNKKVIGITAAMPSGTGLDILQREIPDRYVDVGIAEQHAVTLAAGIAAEGYIPVVCIYSTFLQRAIDQIIHDVALQNLHVVFALDRGGLVGADGATHHGTFDLTYLRMIPNMIVMAPKDEQELRDMLSTAIDHTTGPVAIRYPRASGLGIQLREQFMHLPIGKGAYLRKGKYLAFVAIGTLVQNAMKAVELLEGFGLDPTVVNMRFLKPLDTLLLDELIETHEFIITLEDNTIVGGFGSAVSEYFSQAGKRDVKLFMHGVQDQFIEHGTIDELQRIIEIDPLGICRTALRFIEQSTERVSPSVLSE